MHKKHAHARAGRVGAARRPKRNLRICKVAKAHSNRPPKTTGIVTAVRKEK